MKKFFVIVLGAAFILMVNLAAGQSQRTVLIEEFTNASCGPCASANPALNTLLTTNEAKAVAVKYQWYFPGYDPMHYHNPVEANARMSYYGLNGVPHVMGDGNVFNNHPNSLTQTLINNMYATPSPFTMTLDHVISPDFDSVYIDLIITCTQAVSGNLVAHVVLEENEIHFATAPGSNGETEFYDVMLKMYPNQSGTTLATSWAVGDADTLSFAEALPWYVYNVNQLCVVAFVQDNTGKNVKQAVRSAPITQSGSTTLDAGLSAMTNVPAFSCDSVFTPTVTLKNYNSTVLTSCDINWVLDNGTVNTQAWTGSLAQNATANITLPAVTASGGTHAFKVYVSNPNGSNDLYPINNTQEKTVNIVTTYSQIPVTEGFQGTFPPALWIKNDLSTNGTWDQATVGGFGTSNRSATLEFFNITSGTFELIMPAMDLTDDTSAQLTFNVAYAQYGTYQDRLRVAVSTNCGTTWTNVYDKVGSGLATAPATTSFFVPTSSQWRAESVDLTSYAGNPEVFVKFVGISNYGNNLYVDDVNIQATSSGISSSTAAEASVNVFPNPFAGETRIEIVLPEETTVSVTAFNTLGETVFSTTPELMNQGTHSLLFDGTNLPVGVYYINVLMNEQVVTKKVSLIK